ncbi:beta-N-acetylglucosaminidase domain-containing protein [Amycolatopsis anabasis]|uniref:beta-N-acetylglucosaminidase domain-containing protein n=1 Tax=Amycolatopsis anabasis TaxID=1840409 RepID=UPI00131A83FA|nr:beta-N-acetylglucosaminidase domain-containing protein [Amycolatopsis anabasis]
MRSTRLFLAALLAVTGALTIPVTASAETVTVPKVWPTPQEVQPKRGAVTVPKTVGEVLGEGTDPATRAVVEQVLKAAGAERFVPGEAALTVYLGGPRENPATAGALERLGARGPDGLPAGGYALAAGRGVLALSGVDATGTFYAAQTLRQLVTGRKVPAVSVRDWPATPLRGVIEGFYGAPWSHADRLSQLDFYGRTKQNIYVYSPKDDPYLRERWRDAYPADKLAEIKELAGRAAANHVEFTYALSPGLSVCYSADNDERALVAKFQSLWDIGVRSFAIPLDDISYTTWNCDADKAKFGTGGAAAGAAQSFLLNRVQGDFVATHPGIERLQMVPTEYYDLADTGYKKALREQLDPAVLVEWTGVGVIAPRITEAQARQAKQVFGHDILVWDNYPVNDYVTPRLLLGPYVGREPGITGALAGVTANPMVQAEASKIAEFTSADFLWNPSGYDPDASWAAAVADLGGPGAGALKVFAENNFAGVLERLDTGAKDQDSPVLRPLLDRFWAAPEQAAGRLDAYLRRLAANPDELRRGMAANPAFLDEVGPWLDKLGFYGQAGRHAVRMLLAQRAGDGATAWAERAALVATRARADAITTPTANGPKKPQVCVDVCEPFFDRALATVDQGFGLPPRVLATTSMGTYQDHPPAGMTDRNPATFYWSDRAPKPGDQVGVDLGAVRPVTRVEVTMAKPGSPGDYVHAGVLERSADGRQWTQVAEVTGPEVAADLPPGTQARHLRIRVTGEQANWLVVRDFTVTTADEHRATVTGGPAPAPGSVLPAAADGDADTVYTAAATPRAGDALVVTATRPVDRVVVLGSGAADVQALADGRWRTIGRLRDGYTELPVRGAVTSSIRLLWRPGSPAPRIHEVVPLSR